MVKEDRQIRSDLIYPRMSSSFLCTVNALWRWVSCVGVSCVVTEARWLKDDGESWCHHCGCLMCLILKMEETWSRSISAQTHSRCTQAIGAFPRWVLYRKTGKSIHSAGHMPRTFPARTCWGFSQRFLFHYAPFLSIYSCSLSECVIGKEACLFSASEFSHQRDEYFPVDCCVHC